MAKKTRGKALAKSCPSLPAMALMADVRELIENTRREVARSVNSAPVMLSWCVGKRLREEVLHCKRAGYGKQILQTLSAKLSWSHFQKIISLDDSLKRDFYTEMCRIENWSTHTLQKKIDSMLSCRECLLEQTKCDKSPKVTSQHLFC